MTRVLARLALAIAAMCLPGCPEEEKKPQYEVTFLPENVEAFVGDRFGLTVLMSTDHPDLNFFNASIEREEATFLSQVDADDITSWGGSLHNLTSSTPISYSAFPPEGGTSHLGTTAMQTIMFQCMSEGEGSMGLTVVFEMRGTLDHEEYRYTRVKCKPRRECVEDPLEDLVDSLCSSAVTLDQDAFDIVCFLGWIMNRNDEEVMVEYGNTTYECNTSADGIRVVCPDGVLDMAAGEVVHVAQKLQAAVPDSDPDHSYIYSVVFDSDGDPANDWEYVAPYDCDYFQGTDRWYQCIYDHATDTWTATVTQVDSAGHTTEVPSTARCVIEGDTVTWHISRSELPADPLGYRVSAFGHDGAFSASDRGGDVSGASPTDPLSEI